MVSTTAFTSEIDIGNRALQHLGALRIGAFTDQSKNAAEIAACYDKLRLAELTRNVWRFAIREASLRPIDTTSVTVVPATYNPVSTYIFGSLVQWVDGNYYIATGPVPVNTPPGSGPPWTQYFGPLTAVPWGQSTGGTVAQPWSASTTYGAGAQVLGADGNTYASIVAGNLDNNPTLNSLVWELIASPQTTAYQAGELVYFPPASPTTVYMSLVNNNTAAPNAIPVWDPTVFYNVGDTTVLPGGPVEFNGDFAYFNGTQVFWESSNVWQSTVDLNINSMPANNNPNWENVPITQVDHMVGIDWLQLDSTIKSIVMFYPLGSGPLSQPSTPNLYRLPNAFLRQAPTNPKLGNMSYLGRPSNPMVDDWIFEGDYLISAFTQPLWLRFVADIADVFAMDAMFCEGLAARIAYEVCESLTQSSSKQAACAAAYKQFMGEARNVNGIIVGESEAPLDDYLACRL
jgi:hypothetical protein